VRDDGKLAYLVDPGINGQFHTRPDGTEVKKYDAPKAVLMSYIIKGILDQQLPWTLVLFGVMISVVLEMAGIQALAFSVGVYLPLVSTLPIAIGGAVRWAVDRRNNKLPQYAGLNEEERRPRATAARAPCWRPATSPAARWPASSSPSRRAC
jgi:uncharacterized oligopeptide transporter (OPT) family protein